MSAARRTPAPGPAPADGDPRDRGRERPAPESLPALDPRALIRTEPLAGRTADELVGLGRLEQPLRRGVGEAGFRPAPVAAARRALAGLAAGPGPLAVVLDDPDLGLETAWMARSLAGRGAATRVYGPWLADEASAPGLGAVIGHTQATCAPGDLARADLVLLLGVDPRRWGGLLSGELDAAARDGRRLFAVDVRSDPGWGRLGAPTPEDVVTLAPGGDRALLEALAQGLIEEHWHRPDVIQQCTSGFEAWRESLQQQSQAARVAAAGVAPAAARRLLEALARAERQLIVWGGGLTGHAGAAGAVAAAARLALLSEAVGRPGTGLLPLPRHPAEPVLAALGGVLPAGALGREAGSGRVADAAALVCLGGDPRGRSPLPDAARTALAAAPARVHLGPLLDPAMLLEARGEVWLLPTPTPSEDPAPASRVGVLRGVRALPTGSDGRRGAARAAVAWLADLAGAPAAGPTTGSSEDPAGGRDGPDRIALRARLAAVVPGLAPLTGLAAGGMFRHGGERLAELRRFATPDGRARLAPQEIPCP